MFSNEENPDRFSTGTPTPDNRFGQIPNMTTNWIAVNTVFWSVTPRVSGGNCGTSLSRFPLFWLSSFPLACPSIATPIKASFNKFTSSKHASTKIHRIKSLNSFSRLSLSAWSFSTASLFPSNVWSDFSSSLTCAIVWICNRRSISGNVPFSQRFSLKRCILKIRSSSKSFFFSAGGVLSEFEVKVRRYERASATVAILKVSVGLSCKPIHRIVAGLSRNSIVI